MKSGEIHKMHYNLEQGMDFEQTPLERLIESLDGYVVLDNCALITTARAFFSNKYNRGYELLGDKEIDRVYREVIESIRTVGGLDRRHKILVPLRTFWEFQSFFGKLHFEKQRREAYHLEREQDKISSDTLRKRDSFFSIVNRLSPLRRMLLDKIVSYESDSEKDDFSDLFKLMVSLSDIFNIKKKESLDDKHRFNDEHILATGIYFSLLNERPVAFCTKDPHFLELMNIFRQAVLSPYYEMFRGFEYSRRLQECVQQNPIRIYSTCPDKCYLEFSTEHKPEIFRWDAIHTAKALQATKMFLLKKRKIFEKKK